MKDGHMDEKTIRLCESYRLVVFDARNWKLQEWREPSASRDAKDRSPRWFDTGSYFQQLGTALAYVFERRMREEGEPDESLADAMERAERIRDELMGVRA